MLYILKMWLLDDFSIPVAISYCLMEKTLLSGLGSIFYENLTHNLMSFFIFFSQLFFLKK